MNFTFTNKFMSENTEFMKDNMMGPNAMRITEELVSYLDTDEQKRVLDLGCGKGLSTLLLAQKSAVFAADLWTSPTENYQRFKQMGIEQKAIPISADASKGLPFAEGYFDILFSVDAYHYFGNNESMLPTLIPYVKKGGYIAVAVPGLKEEFGENVPEEMQPFWTDELEVASTIRSIGWWRSLWDRTDGIELICCREMDCCKRAWDEWLTCPNPYAQGDIKMMEAENGQYFNIVQMIAKVL